VADDPDLAPRIACFLCHLAAEKALKACLIVRGHPLRKLHDLIELRARPPAEPGSGFDPADLRVLNTWLVEGRYPTELDEPHAPRRRSASRPPRAWSPGPRDWCSMEVAERTRGAAG
jgi:hypothetical protein